MPIINCKVELSLNWIENCVLTSAAVDATVNNTGTDSATFKITDAKSFVPIITLSAEDNAKLSKLLGEGFKRFIYWNKYKVIDNLAVEIPRNKKNIKNKTDKNWKTTWNNVLSVKILPIILGYKK